VILVDVELALLMPNLHTLLEGMRQRLSAPDDPARADVDIDLAVALSLRDATTAAPVVYETDLTAGGHCG
jgi:hypothetical protein